MKISTSCTVVERFDEHGEPLHRPEPLPYHGTLKGDGPHRTTAAEQRALVEAIADLLVADLGKAVP